MYSFLSQVTSDYFLCFWLFVFLGRLNKWVLTSNSFFNDVLYITFITGFYTLFGTFTFSKLLSSFSPIHVFLGSLFSQCLYPYSSFYFQNGSNQRQTLFTSQTTFCAKISEIFTSQTFTSNTLILLERSCFQLVSTNVYNLTISHYHSQFNKNLYLTTVVRRVNVVLWV